MKSHTVFNQKLIHDNLSMFFYLICVIGKRKKFLIAKFWKLKVHCFALFIAPSNFFYEPYILSFIFQALHLRVKRFHKVNWFRKYPNLKILDLLNQNCFKNLIFLNVRSLSYVTLRNYMYTYVNYLKLLINFTSKRFFRSFGLKEKRN